MGSHGIRNRSPRRRFTDAIEPQTPSPWLMVSAAIGVCATLAVWVVIVTLILSH